MEKLSIFLFILFFGHACIGQDNLMPAGYEPISEALGDLDKDGIAEKVVVYNMNDSVNEVEGTAREIIIFKKEKNDWLIWQRSLHAVRGSRASWMGENPFLGIEIKNGILIIIHTGGGRWKWHDTDKYRFQNNSFELIGFTKSYGALCEYWQNIDFNISTGKVFVKKEYEKCENQQQVISKRENESFNYKLKEKVTLANRKEIELEITSPKFKHQFYL